MRPESSPSPRRTQRWRRAARRTAVVLAVLGVVAVGVEVWAHLMLDRSGVARALVWRDADVDDWRRFPSEPVPRGSQVLPLRTATGRAADLGDVEVDGARRPLADLLTETDSTSFLVLRDDRLLVEDYPSGGGRDQVTTSFSMAKSVLSTALGIAIERGEVRSLDDPVTDYLPELADRDDRFARITLRNLVSMSSGLHYVEHGLPWSDDARTYYDPDLRALALSATVEEAPGRTWLYNNYNPLLVGMVLERATGRSVPSYVAEHLWAPMGAAYDASWSLDSEADGFAKMESGFNARPVDYARLGYLFAHEGRSLGRQVVPADWVAGATEAEARTDPNDGYQWFWWVDTDHPGCFMARGNKGQFIYVDPRTDVVVVRTGRDFGIDSWPEVLGEVAARVGAS